MTPHPCSLLVVDDEAYLLPTFPALLEPEFEVVKATNSARAALEEAAGCRPDALILDISMPQMDGIEFCHRVRSDADLSTIPVLLVSGIHKDSSTVVKGLRTGAFDYLESPYDPGELLAKIARLLEVNKVAEALRESEEKYRMLMSQASDGIAVIDQKGTFIEINNRACEILGYSCEEIRLHNVREFIPQEDLLARPLRLPDVLAGRLVHLERQRRRLRLQDREYRGRRPAVRRQCRHGLDPSDHLVQRRERPLGPQPYVAGQF